MEVDFTQRYSMKWLLDSISSGNVHEYVYFWSEKGSTGCYSQWFMSNFEVDGRSYCCMEQYMMAQKAILFKDIETLGKIFSSTDPRMIKAYGREVKGFDPVKWGDNKSRIVFEGNMAKFGQNEVIRNTLLTTGDKVLAEASPYDRIWGIGMRASEASKSGPGQWKGENLLGFALMQVRDELKEYQR